MKSSFIAALHRSDRSGLLGLRHLHVEGAFITVTQYYLATTLLEIFRQRVFVALGGSSGCASFCLWLFFLSFYCPGARVSIAQGDIAAPLPESFRKEVFAALGWSGGVGDFGAAAVAVTERDLATKGRDFVNVRGWLGLVGGQVIMFWRNIPGAERGTARPETAEVAPRMLMMVEICILID